MYYIRVVSCVLVDRLLWRQKLSRPFFWVQQRLSWAQHPLQPLQLSTSGERGLGPVWEAQLPGLPVHFDKWRVPGLPTLDGIQWHRQVMSDHTKCESNIIFVLHLKKNNNYKQLVFMINDIFSQFAWTVTKRRSHELHKCLFCRFPACSGFACTSAMTSAARCWRARRIWGIWLIAGIAMSFSLHRS